MPFKLQAVREEDLGLKGLRARGIKPELLCRFPVESQSALVEAVAADLDIACLLAVVKAEPGRGESEEVAAVQLFLLT